MRRTPIRKAVALPVRVVGVSPATGTVAMFLAFIAGIATGAVLAGVGVLLVGFAVAVLVSQREPHIDIWLAEYARRLLAVPGRGMKGYPPARMPRRWGDAENRYDA